LHSASPTSLSKIALVSPALASPVVKLEVLLLPDTDTAIDSTTSPDESDELDDPLPISTLPPTHCFRCQSIA
jgi:hypothetical protein